MLIVTNLSGESEVVTKYNNFEMVEELNEGFTLSFSSFQHLDNPGYELINQESIVEYEGYTFRVKQLRTNTYTKQVTATSTYFDNADKYKYDIYGGTHTLDEFLTYVLADTGWTFINDNVSKSVLIADFGRANVVKLIDQLKFEFGCEMKIEPNNTLRFSTKLGPDNDFQYRYGHNVNAISENIDTTKLKTYIEGFGPNGLHIKYTSPLASSPGIGLRHAEPIFEDSEETTADTLLERLKKELHDRPESTVELDSIELQEKELGESVWLIHEKMGIEYQTRVIVKKTKIPRNLSTVVLGNYKPQTITSALANQKVEIDANRKENRTRFEQTNELILLEASRLDGGIEEAKASITLTADEIRSEVSAEVQRLDGSIGQANSSISQTADEIRSEVSATLTNANAYSDGLVAPLTTRIVNAESSISQQAEQISLRVQSTTYESGISEVKSYADGKAATAESNAINNANNYTDENLETVLTRVTAAESSITQQAEQIALRVTQTTYESGMSSAKTYTDNEVRNFENNANLYTDNAVDTLAVRVSQAESSITQTASSIESKVSVTDFTGATIMSKIEQTPEEIKFSANRIKMEGITHVSGNLELGKDYTSGEKAIIFNAGGSIRYNDGFTYQASTFGHRFRGNVTIEPNAGYILDVTGVEVRGLNVTVSFG